MIYRALVHWRLHQALVREARQMIGPLVRFERFAGWYSAQARRNDAALAWEELRGIIKGACLDTERAMLSRDEYEELGRKRAPLFCAERPRLYQVARKYQEWLRAEGLSDDIDVARRALAAVRQRRLAGYAVVVCDEAQDLTELEVSLLLEMCLDPMCAGDRGAGECAAGCAARAHGAVR